MSKQRKQQIYAAVDLGSNSFHMLVARYENGQLQTIERIKEMVRLAAGLTDCGKISEKAFKRALDCIRRFGKLTQDMHAQVVGVVGTNALRRATNAGGFIAAAERILGHSIDVISGEEEARLVYLGATHGLPEFKGKRLVVDIGGGSTELILGRNYEPRVLHSLELGCVGLTEKFFPGGKITEKRWQRARHSADNKLKPVRSSLRGWDEAMGTSGTIRGIQSVLLENGWDKKGIRQKSLKKLEQLLIAQGHVENLDLTGLSSRRAPVFPGGVVLLQAVFSELKIDSMQAASGAIREGLIYDMHLDLVEAG